MVEVVESETCLLRQMWQVSSPSIRVKAMWWLPQGQSAPPAQLEEEGLQRWNIGVDENLQESWSARERALIDTMESYFVKCEQFHGSINELEHFFLRAEDDAIGILSFCG